MNSSRRYFVQLSRALTSRYRLPAFPRGPFGTWFNRICREEQRNGYLWTFLRNQGNQGPKNARHWPSLSKLMTRHSFPAPFPSFFHGKLVLMLHRVIRWRISFDIGVHCVTKWLVNSLVWSELDKFSMSCQLLIEHVCTTPCTLTNFKTRERICWLNLQSNV